MCMTNYNLSNKTLFFDKLIFSVYSGGTQGGGGMGEFAPPPLAPQSEEKNGQNQPFSANFWIFAP